MPIRVTAKKWKQAKNKNQKWRARVAIKLESGKTKEFVGYGPTRIDAITKVEKKISQILKTNKTGNTELTFDEAFERYLAHSIMHRGIAPTTQEQYQARYERYLSPIVGSLRVLDFDKDHLKQVFEPLLASGHYRTAETINTLIKSILYWVTENYYTEPGTLKLEPQSIKSIKRPKEAVFIPDKVWTPEQVKLFLNYLKQEYEAGYLQGKCFVPAYVFFAVILYSGLRKGEALGLPRDALQKPQGSSNWILDIRQQAVKIKGEMVITTPKSISGKRKIPIPLSLVKTLQTHIEFSQFDTPLVFVNQENGIYYPNSFDYPKDKAIKKLGLPKITIHHMRKMYTTYITRELVNQGAYNPKIVAKLLGHSKTDVALSVYTQIIEADINKAIISF